MSRFANPNNFKRIPYDCLNRLEILHTNSRVKCLVSLVNESEATKIMSHFQGIAKMKLYDIKINLIKIEHFRSV